MPGMIESRSGNPLVRGKSHEAEQLPSLAGPVQLRREPTFASPYPPRPHPAELAHQQEVSNKGARPGTPISHLNYRGPDEDEDEPRVGSGRLLPYRPSGEREVARRASLQSMSNAGHFQSRQQQQQQQHQQHPRQRGRQGPPRPLPGFRPVSLTAGGAGAGASASSSTSSSPQSAYPSSRAPASASSYGPPLRSPPLMRDRAPPTDYYANLSAMNDLNRRRKYDQKMARQNAKISSNAAGPVSAPTDLAPVMLFAPPAKKAPTNLPPPSEEYEKENESNSGEPNSARKNENEPFNTPRSHKTPQYTASPYPGSFISPSGASSAGKPVITVSTNGLPRTGIRDDPSATSSSGSFGTSNYNTAGSLQSINLQSDVSAISAVEDNSGSNFHSGRTTVAQALSLLSAVAEDTLRRDLHAVYSRTTKMGVNSPNRSAGGSTALPNPVPGLMSVELRKVDITSSSPNKRSRAETDDADGGGDDDSDDIQFVAVRRRSSSDHEPTPRGSVNTVMREDLNAAANLEKHHQCASPEMEAHQRVHYDDRQHDQGPLLAYRSSSLAVCDAEGNAIPALSSDDSDERLRSRASSVLSNCSASLEPFNPDRHKRSSLQFLMNASEEILAAAAAGASISNDDMVDGGEHDGASRDSSAPLSEEAAHMAAIALDDGPIEMPPAEPAVMEDVAAAPEADVMPDTNEETKTARITETDDAEEGGVVSQRQSLTSTVAGQKAETDEAGMSSASERANDESDSAIVPPECEDEDDPSMEVEEN